jgi:hypothetical protein
VSDAFVLSFATLSVSPCGETHRFSVDLESTALRRDTPASPIAVKRVVKDCVGQGMSKSWVIRYITVGDTGCLKLGWTGTCTYLNGMSPRNKIEQFP